MRPVLEADVEADAGYVALADRQVARTDRFDSSVLVDVDDTGAIVGVEILSLSAVVDVDGIAARYGLSDDLREELRDALVTSRR